MVKHKWTDKDVLEWAERCVTSSMTLLQFEDIAGVPHSTSWWCFMNRLPRINGELHERVMELLRYNKHNRCTR